ncbi:trypsin-like peptidase domain-containing protein [Ferruginibacter lapsinanis]|uniref:S1C family serine protease n=1 Tax=Ferruginibacter lapsinanis TaxID=563172 RepID=UPI001E4B6CB8|nr:serine protease [Ferruginibacter lapsinanis]UEG49136.1 trypsin-like peptidase domain-containing protein [Ferruginibacter lapsinanis]
MDEVMLLDAVERYHRGEMPQHEIVMFEELRKSNPEVDQLVVEHIYFLQELNKFGALKTLKHSLHEVETKLLDEGFIAQPKLTGTAKVLYLWGKYKRNIAVAASIAGVISIASTGVVVNYAKKYGNENYQELVSKINQTNAEVAKLKSNKQGNTTTPVKVEPKVDYRATGFLIDGKGYLVTNAHVIGKMKNIYVQNNKGEYFTAVAVYTDNTSDLAILKISDASYKAISNLPYSINKTNANLGDQFFTLGYPRNEIVYGEGYVSAKSGSDGDSTAYQLTVSANPGNSGGPVINRNGEIIGIITGKDTKADGVVYATKSKNIFKALDELKKDESLRENIKTPSNNGLRGLERGQQIKKMEEFVFMVVGN